MRRAEKSFNAQAEQARIVQQRGVDAPELIAFRQNAQRILQRHGTAKVDQLSTPAHATQALNSGDNLLSFVPVAFSAEKNDFTRLVGGIGKNMPVPLPWQQLAFFR